MRKLIGKYYLTVLLGVITFGCATITVNIYFPAEAVEKAAEEILNEIEGEGPEAIDAESSEETEKEGLKELETATDESELQSSLWLNIPAFFLDSSMVYAGDDIDLDLTSPAIRKVIKSMKLRNPQIRRFKNEGVVGETFDGKLAIRDLSSLKGKDIRTVKQLLKAEDADRNTLYKELAKANKIPETEVTRIGKIFAKTRRTKLLKKDQWYKDENGIWMQM